MAEHTPLPTPYRAVYGFALYLFFKTLFIIYLLWAFVPETFIKHELGLPHKYFALYIPILVLCCLTVFGFFIYPLWNLSMQHCIHDVRTMHDRYSLHRCEYTDGTYPVGRKCEKKINEKNNGSSNVWQRAQFCDLHKSDGHDGQEPVRNTYNGANLDDFCDCIDKSQCMLHKHPEHINLLRSRATVPSVCDIDIVDVCHQLFRKK